jgi:hypothetical protein
MSAGRRGHDWTGTLSGYQSVTLGWEHHRHQLSRLRRTQAPLA